MRIANPRSFWGLRLRSGLWWCLVLVAVGAPGSFANDCELQLHNGNDVNQAQWDIYLNLQSIGWENLDDNAKPRDVYYKFTNARNVNSVNLTVESKYFEAIYDEELKTVSIITNELFPNFKENSSTSQRNEIHLNFECTSGSRPFQIVFMVEDSNKYHPKMNQSEYLYELAMPLAKGYIITSIQPIEGLDYDFTTTNIRALISNSNNTLFTVETIPRDTELNRWRSGFEVKITATKEVRLKEKLEIPLTIQDDGTNSDPTIKRTDISVVIIPDLENTVYNPRFRAPLYNANGQEVTVEEISNGLPLVDLIDFEEGYSEDLEYSMQDGGSHDGEDAMKFIKWEKDQESKGVRLLWREDSDPEQLKKFLDKAFALLILTAEVPSSLLTPSARTVIHVSLPGSKIGPSTSGPGTTTDSGLLKLKFEKEWYNKTIATNEKEGSEIALIQLEENYDGVSYSLEGDSDTSPTAALHINGEEGRVTLVFPPRAGTHLYHVLAEVPGVGKGKAQLWLYVANIPDERNHFQYALEVRRVPENTKMQVWPGDGNNERCITILGSEKHFTVEETIIYSKEIDREADDFGGVESPVVTLEIRSCQTKETFSSIHEYQRSHRLTWDEAVGNIKYDQFYTKVAVIIEDANDNAPRFDPASLVIGYPDGDLAAALRMSSLLMAEAEDRDVGLNAALRYSLDERGAKRFEVHPHTGAVYPRNDAAAVGDDFRFTVRATDREGSPGDDGTLTGDLQVTVRLLRAEHLLEMRVQGVLLEDVDELLESVSAGGGATRQLRALSAVVLPGGEDANENEGNGSDEEEEDTSAAQKKKKIAATALRRRRRRSARSDAEERAQSKTSLRVVVYSIAGGKPELADDFESDVKKTLSEQGLPTETSRPNLGNETILSKSNNSGLLAAVITLGVLLGLVFVAAGVAGYWFAVRPRMQKRNPPQYNHKSDKLSESMVEIEPISEDFLKKTRELEEDLREAPTPRDLEVIAEMDIPRPMIIFNDELTRETGEQIATIDDAISEAGTLDTINTYETIGSNGDQRPLPKKSVVFNEDVDCIEIRL